MSSPSGKPKRPSELALQRAFEGQVHQLQRIWDVRYRLYEHGNLRPAFCSEKLGSLGLILLNALLDSCIMMCSRLTDPMTQGRFDNLSLDRYLELAGIDKMDQCILTDYEAAMKAADEVRPFRDKIVGHYNADYAGREYDPIPRDHDDPDRGVFMERDAAFRRGLSSLANICRFVRRSRGDSMCDAQRAEDERRQQDGALVDWMCQALESAEGPDPRSSGPQ